MPSLRPGITLKKKKWKERKNENAVEVFAANDHPVHNKVNDMVWSVHGGGPCCQPNPVVFINCLRFTELTT